MPLAPPAVPVFPAGYDPVFGDFDNWIENTLGFQTTGIVFRAEQHTAQSVAAHTNVTITFGTILEDPYSGWSSGSSTWTAPYTGLYDVSLTVCTNAVSQIAGAVITTPLQIMKAGAGQCPAGFAGGAAGSFLVALTAGQGIRGQAYTSSAGVTLSSTGNLFTTMEITYVSQ